MGKQGVYGGLTGETGIADFLGKQGVSGGIHGGFFFDFWISGERIAGRFSFPFGGLGVPPMPTKLPPGWRSFVSSDVERRRLAQPLWLGLVGQHARTWGSSLLAWQPLWAASPRPTCFTDRFPCGNSVVKRRGSGGATGL